MKNSNMRTQKNILCYGDSNTWGFVAGTMDPETLFVERYARTVRWPGNLQAKLGDNYHIIEEGLNGRTTNITPSDFPYKNGKSYLLPCLYSHAPLDLVILLLGANDLKHEFNRPAEAVSTGLADLIDVVQATTYGSDMQSAPEVLVVSYPVIINDGHYIGPDGSAQFAGAASKSTELTSLYETVAQEKGCHHLNITEHVTLSNIDGIHLDAAGHEIMAKHIAGKVQAIFS